MVDTHVAVIGAGPYGLTIAGQLRDRRVESVVFGEPMSFWRGMPRGMLLRSNWTASSISDYRGPVSLDAYQRATGTDVGRPVPLERFVEYGAWVQRQVAPDIDRRAVARLEPARAGFRLTLEDGETIDARRVVVACGIGDFAYRPPEFAHLPPQLVSHTGAHSDLAPFAGKRVVVVGGGQSALECAALIHESGGSVEVVSREERIRWLRGGRYHRLLGPAAPLVYAPTDVGPMVLSRLLAVPEAFRTLPRSLQAAFARRAIRPAGAEWLRPRLAGVRTWTGDVVARVDLTAGGLRATLRSGRVLEADHLLLGTGYRVDVTRYPFLDPELLRRVRRVEGYPVLRAGLESSLAGLHFVGAPAAWSFGPIMRFVSGSWYAGRAVARSIRPGASSRAAAPRRGYGRA